MTSPSNTSYTDWTSGSDKQLIPPSSHRQGLILYFWASWHTSSAPRGSTHQLFETLASVASTSSPHWIHCVRIEAESCPSLCHEYNVSVVPTFVLVYRDNSKQTMVQKWEGTAEDHVVALTRATQSLVEWVLATDNSTMTVDPVLIPSSHQVQPDHGDPIQSSHATTTTTTTLEDRLKTLIHQSKVMLFMKGLPSAPQCGFSRQICQILNKYPVPYEAFNILQDEQVRQGLKEYSQWPTYPQLYVDGNLIGGLDIVRELEDSGELEDVLRG